MLRRHLGSALLTVGLLITTSPLARAGGRRALLELFTSQGCSSCPPADKLLGDLTADPSLVAVSLPIDYWDYLGWKDTLARPAHSARQRAYAHMREDRQVYTPQVVVNGGMHVLGSDRAAIERVIAQTNRRDAAIMSLPVLVSVSDSDLMVNVGGSQKRRLDGEVWLWPLERAVRVAIGRGENRGRTITYHNVVRHRLKLGDFTGAAESWSIPAGEILTDGIDGAVVLVQEGTDEAPGIILGAAFAPLGKQMGDEQRQTTSAR